MTRDDARTPFRDTQTHKSQPVTREKNARTHPSVTNIPTRNARTHPSRDTHTDTNQSAESKPEKEHEGGEEAFLGRGRAVTYLPMGILVG